MCGALWREAGLDVARDGGFQVRALDATTVQEPGKTGSLWRLHYSVRLPSLACDFFRLTPTKGVGTVESLRQFPVQAADYLLAERGYFTARGLLHVERAGDRATVRVNTSSLPLHTPENEPFDLLAKVEGLQRAGMIGSWPVQVVATTGDGAGLRRAQDPVGHPHRPQGPPPTGLHEGHAATAADLGVR